MFKHDDILAHLKAKGKHRWRLYYQVKGNANPRCYVADAKRWPKGQRLPVHINTFNAMRFHGQLSMVGEIPSSGYGRSFKYYVYKASEVQTLPAWTKDLA